MLYKVCHGVLPQKLGFIYYRYPYGKATEDGSDIEQGVEYITCTELDLQTLTDRALAARTAMDNKEFDPNPVPKYCRFCDYESICKARQAQREANSRKRKKSLGLDLDTKGEPFFEFSLPKVNKN